MLPNPLYFEARRRRALLTAAQSAEADQRAARAGVSGRRLMDAAGRVLAKKILEGWPDGPVTIACGPGNNGGDGYAAARHLQAAGRKVKLYALAPPRTSDACQAADSWRGEGGGIEDQIADAARLPGPLLDALFGAGLSRPLSGPAAALATLCAESGKPVISADLPSGLDGNTGRPLGPAFRARLTVAFERARPGHYLGEGPRHCGTVCIEPIGIPDSVWSESCDPPEIWRNHPSCWQTEIAKRDPLAHKYTYGHVLILGGPPGGGGAARLAAYAALRTGAGAVTLAVPPAALTENAVRLDAIMLRVAEDAEAFVDLLEDSRINSVLLGPGAGTDARIRAMVAAVLDTEEFCAGRRQVVLDADALTVFAGRPDELFAKLHRGHAVLTPHAGEFAQLFPDLAVELREKPEPATRTVAAAAARAGAAVLLKGGCTLIAGPDRQEGISLNIATGAQAAPWLATAGAGDVLAGLAAGFAARGFGRTDSASAAAWIHAEAARGFGPGLIADDLPQRIPAAIARAITLQDAGQN